VTTTTMSALITAAEDKKRAAERRVSDAVNAAKRVHDRAMAEGRSALNASEAGVVEDAMIAKREAADDVSKAQGELESLRRQAEGDADLDRQMRTKDESYQLSGLGGASRGRPSLKISEQNLRAASDAIASGRPWSVQQSFEERTLMTTSGDFGSDGAWATSRLPAPMSLRDFAGIPVSELTGTTAEMPSYTLPSGTTGVAEATAHSEYNTVDKLSLTVLRSGRWSEVTAAVDAFDDLSGLNDAHGLAIARDLTLADFTAIETSAGSAVAFSASIDQNVRAAILKVSAVTLTRPEDIVLVGTSADLALVTGYTPANGADRGSVTTRVFGARVFPFEQATAGFVLAFAPAAYRAFQGGSGAAFILDPTNGSRKFGQWVHYTAAGVAVVGGAVKQDVVTP
jgi:hypothetical protein